MCMATQIDKFKHRQSVIRAVYLGDSEKKTSSFNHADHSFTIWRVNVKKKETSSFDHADHSFDEL